MDMSALPLGGTAGGSAGPGTDPTRSANQLSVSTVDHDVVLAPGYVVGKRVWAADDSAVTIRMTGPCSGRRVGRSLSFGPAPRR